MKLKINALPLFLIVSVFFVLSILAQKGKNPDVTNDVPLKEQDLRFRNRFDQKPEFESKYLNQIWRVSQIKYEKEKETLAEIKKELRDIDELEKKVRAEEGISGGSQGDDFRLVLRRFFDKFEKLKTRQMKLTPQDDSVLTDKQLKELWAKVAKLEDILTQEDMYELEIEFLHCEDKVMEFEMVVKSNEKMQRIHHLIEQEDKSDFRRGMQQRTETLEALEKVFGPKDTKESVSVYFGSKKEVALCYDRLSHYVNDTIRKQGFKEPIIVRLWQAAQKNNFSNEELEQLKNELGEFEKQLRMQTDLERRAEKMDKKFHMELKNNEKVPDDIKQGVDEKLRQMKQEKTSKKKELGQWFKSLTDRVRVAAPSHDEM